MLAWLTPLFALTAILYASVGFAGGSTYTALLVLSGVDAAILPIVSLSCNIIVASGGVWTFARAGAIPWRRALLLLAFSVPAAWLGGRTPIDKASFVTLLGWSLAVAGLLLLIGSARGASAAGEGRWRSWAGLAVAAPIGLLSGLVGIGGGIFLAPILHLIRWDDARKVAGTAAIFILANSISGIFGQMMKLHGSSDLHQALNFYPLAIAVIIGGQLGSRFGAKWLPISFIRRLTGVVVLMAAVRLLTS